MKDDDLLVGDAERECAVAMLQQATEEGRLTLGEYSSRLDAALAARARGQLGELVRDIPASSHPVRALSAAASKITAILGNNSRTGRWQVAGEIEAVSILGTCKLDLRDAEIQGSEIVIKVTVVLGSMEILVPPGVRVEMEQVSVMAGRSEKRSRHEPVAGAPVVYIQGSVYLGSITVKDSQPGWRDAINRRVSG
jgi:hypothetical protein